MIPSSPATRSNPCQGGATKFAPIHDALGACVPTLYAAETVQAAIYETILHDVPLGAAFKSVPHDAVESRQHSTLVVRRTLHLASLRAPDLMKWGLTPATLIGSMPTQYPYTARWAKALHDQFAQVDGLVWTSNLCDPDIRTRPCSSSGTVST
ncbi:MAG: RES family NAD+ phosphorylase [Gammaproteobacteria bacterium]|nr:RES family NAD+ phosphorylase [Gammaproteobacteria bacterium]